MKIVVFLYGLGHGGAERVSVHLTRYWAECGHEVTLITLQDQDSDSYGLDPRVRRESLALAAESKGLVSALLNNVKRVRALRAALRRLNPDFALAMMNTANVLLALAGRGLPGLRLGSERVHPPAVSSGRFWAWLRRRTYGWLDGVVAQTEDSAVWLRAHTRARRVEVIPNPVAWPLQRDLPLLDPSRVCRPGRRLLLAAGRLTPQKQFEHAVVAFAELAVAFPAWDLVILGEGPERAALERQIETSGLARRVFLPGRAGNLADWYERAELLLMCSLFEGFPNVLIEAMSAGVPVVSYDCDTGPRDVIRHGTDGLLVPADDHAALVSALRSLMGDEALRSQLARCAVQARQRFSLERIGAQWDALASRLACPARPQ
jgi:glycosyltransferase involved in cell wall biosynthesis